MKKMIGVSILLFMAIFIGNIAVAESIFPYKFVKETLPNGLTVILVPMESPGLVAYYSVVRTGSRDEVEPGKSGFAHFFEHMMFRGTKKYPGNVYDSIVTSIGADANAYTTDDYTCYHMNFAKDDLETVIDIESDRFQNLYYEKQPFQTEAGAVYGEYRKNVTQPFALLNEKVQDLAFDLHTYKHTTMGFEADIKAMPEQYEYSLSFLNRFYRPENVVILITGDVDSDGTINLIKKYYGSWQKGYVSPAIQPEPPQTKERTGEVAYTGKTLPIIDIAYKGDAFDPDNKDYVAAMLLGDIAFGENSELYKKLVIQEQKVQFLGSGIPMNRDLPLFEIYSMIKSEDDINYIRDEVFKTLESFKTNPVDDKKLKDLKKRNKYGFLMGLDTPDHVAGGLARLVAITGGIDIVDRLYTKLENITAEDIQKAAQKYFTPERRTVVVLKGAK
ncbi:MAG: insulinase family protein [Ignavibacteriales bacterium]|nr:insulinase family protein [Ignavibacteriales bacterium]